MQNRLLSIGDIGELMVAAESCLLQILNTSKCNVFYLTPESALRKYKEILDGKNKRVEITHTDCGELIGIVGKVVQSGQMLELANHQQSEWYNQLVDIDTKLGSITNPIISKGKIYGVYQVVKINILKLRSSREEIFQKDVLGLFSSFIGSCIEKITGRGTN